MDTGRASHDGDREPITKKSKSCGAELRGTTRVEDETGTGLSYDGTTASLDDVAAGIFVVEHPYPESDRATEADSMVNCVDVSLYHGAVCDSHVRSW